MKKNIGILFTFFSFIISSVLVLNPVLAQTTAGLLSNGVQQFFDNSGNPVNSGKVYFYEVGTSTFKDTYTSSAATTINPNPIILNAGGKAPTGGIYGIGTYRQVVKDRNNNLIWDAVTAPGGGGGSTPTNVGDGNLVGTILPWSGLIAPNQYVFAYGQEISRTTYPEFFTAVTQQSNVVCSAASNILTGLADTTQIPIGAPIELSLCVNSGTTVVSKTASTVTLSNPASVSINAIATFFPFGNGNGTTTFNVPDLRGYVIAGRDNMGGSAAGRLTSTYFNTPGLNAVGGSQSYTLLGANLPAVAPTFTGSPVIGVITGAAGGFLATSGVQGAGGAGSLLGNVITPTITVTAAGTISNLGTSTPFSKVQPTITLNYVIKITPDTSTSIATGVYSIGGMSGVIACGSGLLCTGNTISWNASSFAGGSNTQVQYSNNGQLDGDAGFTFISPNNLVLGLAGHGTGIFDLAGTTSGRVRQTVQSVAGTPTITWGNTSGTPAVTASLPIVLNTATGNLTCPTCATSTLNGAALTRVDDTNVTLTLGGSPSTALLNAASITAGWSGQLSPTRGGTGSNLSATGGTGQVLKQTTVGGNVTVAQLSASELSNGTTGTTTVVLASGPTIIGPDITSGFTITSVAPSGQYARGNGSQFVSSVIQAGDLPTIPNTSGSPSASFGAVKVDGVTITSTSGILSATGAVPASSLTGTTLASNVVTSSLTSVGTLIGGALSTGVTIQLSNVSYTGSLAGSNVATAANASGAPSATFGVVKCDGTTITCSSGVITAVGAASTAIAVGTTTVSSGTSPYLLYNNAGVLGNIVANQLPGTATNDAASAGNIGQTISSTVLAGSAVALTTNTSAVVTSISLAAGDWDVWGACSWTGGATTLFTYGLCSIDNVNTGTNNALGPSFFGFSYFPSGPAIFATFGSSQPPTSQITGGRVSLASTTTIYLNVQAGFTTSTASGFGAIYARRRR